MMIILTNEISIQISDALRNAGDREIGGILMAEHVGRNCFRVVEITIQNKGGTSFNFIRMLEAALSSLTRFFRRNAFNYRRFNYLGEWHSHPNCPLSPSQKDLESMAQIAGDPSVGANFVVLLLTRLAREHIQASCWFFLPSVRCFEGRVILEEGA